VPTRVLAASTVCFEQVASMAVVVVSAWRGRHRPMCGDILVTYRAAVASSGRKQACTPRTTLAQPTHNPRTTPAKRRQHASKTQAERKQNASKSPVKRTHKESLAPLKDVHGRLQTAQRDVPPAAIEVTSARGEEQALARTSLPRDLTGILEQAKRPEVTERKSLAPVLSRVHATPH
jgi:ABC-type glutathione transport system ATPase component